MLPPQILFALFITFFGTTSFATSSRCNRIGPQFWHVLILAPCISFFLWAFSNRWSGHHLQQYPSSSSQTCQKRHTFLNISFWEIPLRLDNWHSFICVVRNYYVTAAANNEQKHRLKMHATFETYNCTIVMHFDTIQLYNHVCDCYLLRTCISIDGIQTITDD